MILELIENSFLLTQKEKDELINSIQDKNETFIKGLLEILQTEKIFLLQLLKTYKNKNIDIGMIKQEMIAENMKKIRELEEKEKENIDEKIFLENI